MKYNNNNNNNINMKKYLYCFYCLILFLMFICIILLPLLFIYSGNNNINNNNNYNNNYNNKPLIINYSTKEIKEYIHYKQNKKLLTKLANKLSQTKQQQQNNKKNKKDNNNKKDKNNNNINNNDNNNIDLNNDLFEIAKTMPYTVKDKKDVKVITYYDDTPNCNVYGYTKYDKDTNTKIIGINLYNANTNKKVIETLYHESYSDKKHKLNEESAKRYSNYYARVLSLHEEEKEIDINKLNKDKLKENSQLTGKIFTDFANKNIEVEFYAIPAKRIIRNSAIKIAKEVAMEINPAVGIVIEVIDSAVVAYDLYNTGKDMVEKANKEQEQTNTKEQTKESIASDVNTNSVATTGGGDNNRNGEDDDGDGDDEKGEEREDSKKEKKTEDKKWGKKEKIEKKE